MLKDNLRFLGTRRIFCALALVMTLSACGGGSSSNGPSSGTPTPPTSTTPPDTTPPPTIPTAPAPDPTPAPNPTPPVASPVGYTALTWPEQQPSTQYTLADGTLVTRIGGRTRDRHAREQPEVAGQGDPYTNFAAHYFERRTHEVVIYENVSPKNPDNRILTIVVRPQWWLYGTNFRGAMAILLALLPSRSTGTTAA